MNLKKLSARNNYRAINISVLIGLFILPAIMYIPGIYSSSESINDEVDIAIPQSSQGWINITWPSVIPDVNITFIKESDEISVTLAQMVEMADYTNGTLPMQNTTIDNKGVFYEAVGFNPIYLFEQIGWTDMFEFTAFAVDDFSCTYNTTDFLMTDGEFVKNPVTNYSNMIILLIDGDWLINSATLDKGDFLMFGETMGGFQKVSNITTVEYTSAWDVDFKVNGENQVKINYNNATVVGNYTTYDWGYFDEAAGYGWNNRSHTGITIASIIALTNITTENYEVRFSSYDGYGTLFVFTKDAIENGYTGETINDPEVPLLNEGKQPMLMMQSDGIDLGYSRGPFQLIIPGANKGKYIGGILTVEIVILENTDDSGMNSKIPSFFAIIPMIILSISLSAMIMHSKKQKIMNL